MTPKKTRALAALLAQPTTEKAAKASGLSSRTLRLYLHDPEFLAEYRAACADYIADATRQAQQALSPALSTLASIASDKEEASTARVSAARALVSHALQLTEISDVLTRLEAVERFQAQHETPC